MTPPSSDSRDFRQRRVWHVIATAAVGMAAAGFFAGVSRPPERTPSSPAPETDGVSAVPTYGGLSGGRRGPNGDLYPGGTRPLAAPYDLLESHERTPEERARALEERDARRAYDGAPPTIPHAIDQRGFPDCLSCHGEGVRIQGRIAPAMSHRRYDSCTQCHVVDQDPRPGGNAPDGVPNGFVGTRSANPGERAWQGAPPTIPHPTHMRSDCMSCHGPQGRLGLRSSHPWRQSCTQCHAPSAELDQRALLALEPPGATQPGATQPAPEQP